MSEEQQTTLVIPAGLGMSVGKVLEESQNINFVPWLTLTAANSDALKKNTPEGVRAGLYVLGGRKLLPEGFRVLPVGVGDQLVARSHATCDDPELESFVQDDETWGKIEAARGRKDGNVSRVGMDQLLYLPEQRSFAMFGFSNTFAREMPDLIECYTKKKLATFKSRLVGKKNEWFVPTIAAAPVGEAVAFPTPAATQAAIEYFFAPVLAYQNQKPAAENPTSRPR
jgi:hypothetical protein